MANEKVHTLLRYVRQVVGPPDEAAGTDGQLLGRFVRERDEAAFLALVQRHGPMVLGVCRRVLAQAQDAEDAFQATFLVLVRKAHAVAHGDRLSGWLYGVAVRTASKLKVREARRRKYERRAGSLPRAEPEPDGPGPDLSPILDQEIQQLPKKYRLPLVLCYLEGKTNREAAEALGCPAGTVSRRLAWARQRLRARLARRGVAPTAGFAAIGWAEGELGRATAAAIAAELEARTVQLALQISAGNVAATGGVAPRAVILTGEVMRTMFWTSWKGLAVAGLLAVSLIGAGAGVYASEMLMAGEPDGTPTAAQDKESSKPEALKQEVARLQAELQKLQEEIGRLRAKLDAPPDRAKPVLFRGKPAADWIEALEDRDPAYRQEAIRALGGIAEVDRSVIPVLIASLKDRNLGVRNQAAESLGSLGVVALPALQDIMKSGSVEARVAAAFALDKVGHDAVPTLAKALHDADDSVVRAAIESLITIGQTEEEAAKALQAAARASDAGVRRRVVQGVGEVIRNRGFGSPWFRAGSPALVEGLNDPDMDVRKLAVMSLSPLFPRGVPPRGSITSPAGLVPALIKLLKDPKIDKPLRQAAYDLLNRIDATAAKEAIGLGGP